MGLEDFEIRAQIDTVIKIYKNTENNPKGLRRLAVIQTPLKNH